MENKLNSNVKSLFIALIVMALWGSLFPFIKIGYAAFNINSSSIPDILMFAGVRFTLCGLVVCILSFIKKETLTNEKSKTISYIILSSVFGIMLHYAFTYIGLSLADGSKTAIIKQLGSLLYVCFAFLFIKSEKFNASKILGAIIGFIGIVAINAGPDGINFSIGEILIILASVCTVFSGVITKLKLEKASPFWITGISQFAGGVTLLIAAFIMGANMLLFNLNSFLVFTYICVASIVAYTLWYYILKTSSLSKLFIIKFTEPLFACVFGAILLGEDIFKWQYLVAFVLISWGIALGNKN